MAVLIDNRQKRFKISPETLRTKAQAVLDASGNPDAELSILVVDDTEIASLNEQYLHRQGPTNVIAFPMQEGEFSEISPQLLGDVVISVETALRESGAAGLAWEERFDQLLVHGILHLLGYDHESGGEEALEMEAQSEKLLAVIRPL